MRARAAWRSGRVRIGGILVAIVLVAGILAPWLAPHDPEAQDLLALLLPPAWAPGGQAAFPLGTDTLGRCVLSRLIWGARVALYVAILASLGAMILGGVLGHVAGYFGGWVDRLISRAVDVWMSFPPVVLSLVLMVGLGVGINNVVLAIILVDWTRFCRVLRADVLTVMNRDYVTAARLAGFGHVQTIWREVLPATLPLLATLVSLEMGMAVVVEAILSVVGMSVEANVPAWGVMIADSRQAMYQAPWNLILPMVAILVAVLGFNLLGDGLRLALDARQSGARAEAP
ncbi:MAG: ABC transporter permease [Alphaproteobacteria bacterium]|nr:ABC transporter permease [Alphaproteobacteria bacterium]